MGRNTIDNNNLEHGLGVGGGRGRPKGSRNGYINPNAAYMKNYEIQGEVADPLNTGLQPQNQQRQRTWAPAPQSNGPTRRMTNQEINTRKAAANNTARTAAASRPATSVQNGKNILDKLIGVEQEKTESSSSTVSNGMSKEYPNLTEAQVSDLKSKNATKGYLKLLNANSAKNVYPEGAVMLNEQTIPENVIKEKTIPENITKEQYLTETKPIETKPIETKPIETKPIETKPIETKPDPLADAWNGLLEWGKNAWGDISEVATSVIDTGRGWAKSGLDWLNDNVLNPASEWGSRAVSDVSSWIGDRGRDLDRWWNGYQEEGTNVHGSPEKRAQRQEGHVPGFRENAENAINNAARDAGQWIGDRGRDLDRWWNGYQEEGTNVYGSPEKRAQRQEGHVPGFRENAGNAINGAVRSVGNFVNGAARDAGQWIGDRAQDVDRWWNGYQEEGTNVHGSPEKRAQRQEGHVPGFRENAENAIGDAARRTGNALNSAARSAGEFATRAANDVGQFVSEKAQDAVDLAGTTIQKVVDAAGDIKDAVVDGYGNVIGFLEINVGEPVDRFLNGTTTYSGEYNPETGESVTTETHTPGFLENAGSFISSIPGQAQAAAGEAIRTITDAYGNVRKAVVDGAGNFVRWADNAVQDARIGASGVVNQESNTFGGMTNSILAQNARAAGLSPARLARLADAYGPNNVANFESVLFDYANGRISDEQIDEIIRNR